MPPIFQYIQQLLAATPFQPFSIRLTIGETIQVNSATGCSFPITGQGVMVTLISGHRRAITDSAISYVQT
jgi:uncharacterized protein YlxW (UPF0749 family)